MVTPAYIRTRKRRERQRLMREQLATPCLFCGSEDEPTWHHVNPHKKVENVVTATSYKKMKQEMDKCWCLCEDCHIKLHQRLLDPLPHLYEGY